MDEKPIEMKSANLLDKAENFRESVLNNVSKKKIPITFPEEVYTNFTSFAKKNSADCYWLAIKQLLDFHKEQTEGDVKTLLLMQQINDLWKEVEELKLKRDQSPEPKKYKTFGKEE